MSRLRLTRAARYIHPTASLLVDREGGHEADLDVSGDSLPTYLSWAAEPCGPRLGHRVLEVGAGLGAITAGYERGREVAANDVSPACVHSLRERFADHPKVHVEDRDLLSLELGAL
jgi:hypothetical protein